jgi:hypothetical protein
MVMSSGRDQCIDDREVPPSRQFAPPLRNPGIDTEHAVGKGRFDAVDPRSEELGHHAIRSALRLDTSTAIRPALKQEDAEESQLNSNAPENTTATGLPSLSSLR